MIEQISLKFGAAQHSIKLSIPVTPVTVFVGPNNAGKSRLLTELENWCRQLHGRTDDVLIDGVSFTPWSTDEIEKEILAIQRTPNPNEAGSGQLHHYREA
jgi:ABC-type enterochelin transport system ATPase subunit